MIKIIEYEDKYKDAVIYLWIQICIEEFGFEAWENGIRNMENHEFPKNNGKFLLAIENDELIGTISLKDIGMPQGMLKGFYVRSDYRSKKLGLHLMNQIIEMAKEMGYNNLVLDTYEAFESAVRFYQKYGFTKINQIDDKLIMQIAI